MRDPFESTKQGKYHNKENSRGFEFPDFNTRLIPYAGEGPKSKIGKSLDKGTDIVKKASHFYIYGLGLIALLIILPALIRLFYEFSHWAYNFVGNIFP